MQYQQSLITNGCKETSDADNVESGNTKYALGENTFLKSGCDNGNCRVDGVASGSDENVGVQRACTWEPVSLHPILKKERNHYYDPLVLITTN